MRTVRMALTDDLPDIVAILQARGITLSMLPATMVLAREDGKTIGLLGVDWTGGKHVLAGPVALAPGCDEKKWALLRMIEFMEDFLARAGVSSYLFSTPVDNTRLRKLAEKTGAQFYAEQNGIAWYERKVNSYGRA